MIQATRAVLLLFFVAAFYSCKKEAGPGGLAKIQGYVFVRDLDKNGNLQTEGYAAGERVYIGIPGRPGSFDDVRSAYDGSYEFTGLRKGDYQVWAVSRCDSCLLQDTVALHQITISGRKDKELLPDLIIYR